VALPSCPLKSTDRKGRDTRKGYKKTYLSFLSFKKYGQKGQKGQKGTLGQVRIPRILEKNRIIYKQSTIK